VIYIMYGLHYIIGHQIIILKQIFVRNCYNSKIVFWVYTIVGDKNTL